MASRNYTFSQEQLMMPFGLAMYPNSQSASEDGVIYIKDGTRTIAARRQSVIVSEKNLAFPSQPARPPHEPKKYPEEQLKFYFKGVANAIVTEAPKIDMKAKKGKKQKSTDSPVVATGNPLSLFDEE